MPVWTDTGALLISAEILPRVSVVSVSADYTASVNDQVIECTAALTVTLPAAAGANGVRLAVVNAGTGVVTVDADGSETISGSLTWTIGTQWDCMEIVCDGAAWRIV